MLRIPLNNVARQRVRFNHVAAVSTTSGLNAFIPQPGSVAPSPIDSAIGASSPPSRKSIENLQGRRIAIKDNICVKGSATTCASQSLDGFNSPVDATVIHQLRLAGAEIMEQKTNMDEFGMGSHSTNSAFGPVKNLGEDGTEYSAGGSSGGSAIAVANSDCWAYAIHIPDLNTLC
jgi:aspartyl-tRNA(Asn)/glutamyl-tRNA(Gln) amidotransferase subunit A